MTTTPRIVLVEDDSAMRLYVETALRGLEIEVVLCNSVVRAMAAFDAGPVALLITDLMLPGQSGIELIERVQADPGRFGAPRVVVASAAIDAAGIKARLRALRVWRLLSKPVALDALEACVVEALRTSAGPAADEAPPAPHPAPSGNDVVGEFFGGDEALHNAYRTACLRQFGADVAEGDRRAASADAPALRRLAHNLKSVLKTLGESRASNAAFALEASAHAADLVATQAHWSALRTHLQALRSTS